MLTKIVNGVEVVCSAEEEAEIRAEWEAFVVPVPTYAELRAAEYPPMQDYLDGIVKGDAIQIQAYIDQCLAVKAKYPKPV